MIISHSMFNIKSECHFFDLSQLFPCLLSLLVKYSKYVNLASLD